MSLLQGVRLSPPPCIGQASFVLPYTRGNNAPPHTYSMRTEHRRSFGIPARARRSTPHTKGMDHLLFPSSPELGWFFVWRCQLSTPLLGMLFLVIFPVFYGKIFFFSFCLLRPQLRSFFCSQRNLYI